MQKNNTKWKEQLDFAKVILTFLIVLYHISAPFSNISFWGSAQIYLKNLGDTVVDAFALISGFLFWYNIDTISDVFQKMKRRIVTLLIPYLLWNIINSFIVIFFHNERTVSGILNAIINFNWIRGIFGYSSSPHLWYVFMLIFWTIFSPLLFYVFKNKKLLIFFLLAQVVYMAYMNTNILHSRFIYMIFIWGGVLGYWKRDFFDHIPQSILWAICSAIIFLGIPFACDLTDNMLIKCWLWFFRMLSFIILAFNIKPLPRSVKTLVPVMFWTYAIHYHLDVQIVSKTFVLFTNPVIAHLVSYVCVLVIALGSGFGVKRILPKVFALLSGGRKAQTNTN